MTDRTDQHTQIGAAGFQAIICGLAGQDYGIRYHRRPRDHPAGTSHQPARHPPLRRRHDQLPRRVRARHRPAQIPRPHRRRAHRGLPHHRARPGRPDHRPHRRHRHRSRHHPRQRHRRARRPHHLPGRISLPASPAWGTASSSSSRSKKSPLPPTSPRPPRKPAPVTTRIRRSRPPRFAAVTPSRPRSRKKADHEISPNDRLRPAGPGGDPRSRLHRRRRGHRVPNGHRHRRTPDANPRPPA